MTAVLFILAGLTVLAGLWRMLWEDLPATVSLLDPLDAEMAEVYVANQRERELRDLRNGRHSSRLLWTGVGYPAAAWIHRGRVLGLLPYDASPDSAEQTHQTITRAGSVD